MTEMTRWTDDSNTSITGTLESWLEITLHPSVHPSVHPSGCPSCVLVWCLYQSFTSFTLIYLFIYLFNISRHEKKQVFFSAKKEDLSPETDVMSERREETESFLTWIKFKSLTGTESFLDLKIWKEMTLTILMQSAISYPTLAHPFLL